MPVRLPRLHLRSISLEVAKWATVALVPLLQWQHEVPMVERLAFAGAMGLYVLAKIFEWADHAVLHALVLVSGHTIKHLLAALAAALISWGLGWRLWQTQ
jgi:hypothetical protein